MRMLVDFSFPLEPFNTLVRNGTVGQKIEQIMNDIKPEAFYFSERGGKRGGILIVDIADPSKIPAIARNRSFSHSMPAWSSMSSYRQKKWDRRALKTWGGNGVSKVLRGSLLF